MAKIPLIERKDEHTVMLTCEDPVLADTIESILKNLCQQLSIKSNRVKLARKMLGRGKI